MIGNLSLFRVSRFGFRISAPRKAAFLRHAPAAVGTATTARLGRGCGRGPLLGHPSSRQGAGRCESRWRCANSTTGLRRKTGSAGGRSNWGRPRSGRRVFTREFMLFQAPGSRGGGRLALNWASARTVAKPGPVTSAESTFPGQRSPPLEPRRDVGQPRATMWSCPRRAVRRASDGMRQSLDLSFRLNPSSSRHGHCISR